jgi:hypothetical protein
MKNAPFGGANRETGIPLEEAQWTPAARTTVRPERTGTRITDGRHMAVQTSTLSLPPDCREVSVEIAAVVLFGSVALWLAGVIATRGPDQGT